MAVLHLQLLGPFGARLGKRAVRLPRKAQALLACLALAPGLTTSRGSLATRLWTDGGEDEARNNLRQVLFRMRRALGAAARALVLDGDAVGLDPSLVEIDVARFRRLASDGEEEALRGAAELYRGDLLEGLDVGEPLFEEWLRAERERSRALVIDVLSQLLARQMEGGRAEPAIQTALQLLAVDPLQESAHRALMRAYASAGRRPAALRQYQLCLDALQREVQAEPEPETRQLYLDLLRAARPATAGPEAGTAPRAVPGAPASLPARPLIGRDDELARLRRELAAAGTGRPRVIAILGEAGTGKTRLVQELIDWGAARGLFVVEGRGHETEQGLPFALWVDALRAGGLLDDARAGTLPSPWREALATLFPELAGEPSRPGRRRTEDQRRLFEAVAHLVGAVAARRPLLIALEDMHWADSTSVRLLAFMARRLTGTRVSLIATARVEDGDPTAAESLRSALAELRGEGRLLELTLGPLSREETIALITSWAPRATGPPSAALADGIWRMSEGNPFAVVEAVRALGPRSGGDDSVPLALPESVRRLILARVERLSEPSRDALAAAAVVGRDFEDALVREATGLSEAEAARALEELVRRRLIHQSGHGFDVAHDRIRDAVLGSLLPPRRRLLHAAVARALAARPYPADLDDRFAALAFHHREAGQWAEAVDALGQASLVAAARGAFRMAVSLLDQALDLLGYLPPGPGHRERAIDLRLALADRAMVLGEFDRVETCLREAIDLAAGDEGRTAFARAQLAHRDFNVRNLNRGGDLADQALAAAIRLGDRVTEARASFIAGAVRMTRAEHPAAIALFERAIAASGEDPLTMVTIGLGLCHVAGRAWLAASRAELGHFDEAIPLAEEAVARAGAAQNVFSMAWARAWLGRVHLGRGRLEAAADALIAARDLIDRYELGLIRRMSVIGLARVHVLAGDADAALDLARRGPRTWPTALIAEAEALLALGRLDEAEPVAAEGLTLARGGGEQGQTSEALALLGEVHERRGTRELAREAYESAVAIATALDLRPREAHYRRRLGRVLGGAGELEAGSRQLAMALELYREMGMTRWLEPTRRELEALAAPPAAGLRGDARAG